MCSSLSSPSQCVPRLNATALRELSSVVAMVVWKRSNVQSARKNGINKVFTGLYPAHLLPFPDGWDPVVA